MAEFVPTYVIHNQFRAQSSHAQRSIAPQPFTSVEWLAGRRILPKRPIRLTEKEYKALEQEILAKVREGRLAITCPDLSFIDSRPDGRIFITYLTRPIAEEGITLPVGLSTITDVLSTPPVTNVVTPPEVITVETVVPPVTDEVAIKLETSSDEVVADTSPDMDENSIITLDQPRKKRRKGELNG